MNEFSIIDTLNIKEIHFNQEIQVLSFYITEFISNIPKCQPNPIRVYILPYSLQNKLSNK